MGGGRGVYYWAVCRDNYRDPLLRSLLRSKDPILEILTAVVISMFFSVPSGPTNHKNHQFSALLRASMPQKSPLIGAYRGRDGVKISCK